MNDFKFMCTCGLCGSKFQFGRHIYDGKHIARYQIDVCSMCYAGNKDGWGPASEPRILELLETKGIPIPDRNELGWLPRD